MNRKQDLHEAFQLLQIKIESGLELKTFHQMEHGANDGFKAVVAQKRLREHLNKQRKVS